MMSISSAFFILAIMLIILIIGAITAFRHYCTEKQISITTLSLTYILRSVFVKIRNELPLDVVERSAWILYAYYSGNLDKDESSFVTVRDNMERLLKYALGGVRGLDNEASEQMFDRITLEQPCPEDEAECDRFMASLLSVSMNRERRYFKFLTLVIALATALVLLLVASGIGVLL